MVDNLAKKVDECLLNRGQVLFAYNLDHKNCLLYRVVGCPLVSRDFQIVYVCIFVRFTVKVHKLLVFFVLSLRIYLHQVLLLKDSEDNNVVL